MIDHNEAASSAKSSGMKIVALLSKFSMVGLLATATYFVASNLLMLFSEITPTVASLIAYGLGMIVSFFGQSKFTFQVKKNTVHQAFRFAVLSALGFMVSYFAVKLAVEHYRIHPVWGTIVTAFCVPVMSFVIMNFWVFKADKRS